jgi:RimJ/RimL family protein N-acetyltransferase
MAKKKKKAPARTQKKASRIVRARSWLPTYEGTKVVRAYRKKFHVDVVCAVRELQEIGYEFKPGYVDNLLKAEAARIEQLKVKKEKKRLTEEYNDWQDDRFYFIAGYTPGGAPYGLTWEEMGLEPYENEFDDDEEIVCYRHYDFLNKYEKESVDSRLREDFSRYVSTYRQLPSKSKQQQLIEKVFESCPGGPLQYSKGFNSTYRKLCRKRENAFIREGVLPKRFTPTEMKKLLEQSVMLESERLVFRKITVDDFDDLAVMLRDPEVMTAWEHTFSDEQIQKWIENQISRYQKEIVGYFAAVRKDTEEFVGQMGLLWNDFDELRVLEICYMLKRQYWGMGYATEGAAALAQYAFTAIGLNKVYTSIRPENRPSIRVAERIGMSAEGSFIKQYNGKDMEHIIYSKERG